MMYIHEKQTAIFGKLYQTYPQQRRMKQIKGLNKVLRQFFTHPCPSQEGNNVFFDSDFKINALMYALKHVIA